MIHVKDVTPWKINMEPTNPPFRKENDLPNLHDYVPLQGCILLASSESHRMFADLYSGLLEGGKKTFGYTVATRRLYIFWTCGPRKKKNLQNSTGIINW